MTNTNEPSLADRLEGHVDVLAELIGPRHIGKPTSMAAAATYVEREFTALGDEVERQTYDAGGLEVANLIVERRGNHRPEEVIVIGAHYDTVPTTPGADDNASAVAVLIEVARRLCSSPGRRTVRFVAFACEESPHGFTQTMGSRVYARRCASAGERVVAMLCLEMVGYYTTEPDSQAAPPGIPRFLRWIFPKRGDFLAVVGNMRSWRLVWRFRRGFKRAVRFPLFSISLPEKIEDIRRSDHSSFWDVGYRAVMITDTSFLRNPNYHLPSDTPDTLDYERMAQVTIGVAGALRNFAGRG